MNIICPTGGVTPAIVRFVTSTTPKCTGSMPSLVRIGTKIGVMMISAEVPSTAVPSTISIRLISSSSVVGSLVRPTSQAAICGGIRSQAR